MMSRPGYVLCRPWGGFNDALCQIERCRRYAVAHDRRLYVDTTRSGLQDECDAYLRTEADGVVLHSMPGSLWDVLDRRPVELDGLSSDYPVRWDRETRRRVLGPPHPRVDLSFNFSRAHPESLLVHEQSGGGELSHSAFEWLRLSEEVGEEVRQALDPVSDKEYAAVHVRNTDYRTDYETFFARIEPEVGERVVLCTDDARCAAFARSFFGGRLLPTGQVPDHDGMALHLVHTDPTVRRAMNIQMLTDLFLLASSTRLFFTTTVGDRLSGFSRLANFLQCSAAVRDRALGVGGGRDGCAPAAEVPA